MYSPAADERHFGRHHGGEQNVGRQGQAHHRHKGVYDGRHVHASFWLNAAIGLMYAVDHFDRHVAGHVTNVNLAYSNVEVSAIQIGGAG